MKAVTELDAAAARHDTRTAAGRMVWRAWGSGPPLVLLHGASGSWTHWIRNIASLTLRHRVLAPDMPGFGTSDPCPEPHSAEQLAGLVAEALETVLPPPAGFDIAGFSLGGVIGGLIAARPGARVRRLVLIGPGALGLPGAPLPALVRPADAASADAIREAHGENLARLMIAHRDAIDDLALFVQAQNVAQARFRSGTIPVSDVLVKALPAVRARIAGIWGARDAFVGPHVEARRRLLATFEPALDFRVIDDAGHWVIYEAADRVNAALREILD